MGNKHLTPSTECAFYKLRKQPSIVKPPLHLVSWHGSLPGDGAMSTLGAILDFESWSEACDVSAQQRFETGGGGGLESIRSPQPAAVFVASLLLPVLPHVCLARILDPL